MQPQKEDSWCKFSITLPPENLLLNCNERKGDQLDSSLFTRTFTLFTFVPLFLPISTIYFCRWIKYSFAQSNLYSPARWWRAVSSAIFARRLRPHISSCHRYMKKVHYIFQKCTVGSSVSENFYVHNLHQFLELAEHIIHSHSHDHLITKC